MAGEIGPPRLVVGISALLLTSLLGGCHAVGSPRPSPRVQAERCRGAAAAALPDVVAAGSLREALERFLSDHGVEGWSTSADTAAGLTVDLPPGCDALADGIEARYGRRVVVHRNVVITPVKK